MRSAYSKISKMSKSLVPTLLQKLIEFALFRIQKGLSDGVARQSAHHCGTPGRASRIQTFRIHTKKKPGQGFRYHGAGFSGL